MSEVRIIDAARTCAIQMAKTRAMLAEHPELRSEAIADFVLSVTQAATDLKKIADVRLSGVRLSQEGRDTARFLEDIVRNRYREVFGAELGQ